VRAASRVAFVAWFVVSAGGCAAITGLDSISEQDCAPNCGKDAQSSGGDVTVETSSGGNDSTAPESSSGTDTGGMDTSMPDTSSPVDAHEAGTKEGGDASEEGPVDSAIPPEGSSPDAPFDSGCGALNTTTNCSACGDKCASTATIETSSSCSGDTNGFGATCSYTCASGYQDCNSANVPNLDGCECHVPGATQAQCCLGTGTCPVAHNNGLNQGTSKFFDCNPAGQFSLSMATDACAAMTGNAGECTQGSCVGVDGGTDGDLVVCATGSTTDCVCWTFAGPNVGYFHNPNLPPGNQQQNCYCADKTQGDTTYN
jgi:hypothetical protein